jgi:transposase
VSSQAVGVALPVPRGFQDAFGQQGLGDGGLAGREAGPSFIQNALENCDGLGIKERVPCAFHSWSPHRCAARALDKVRKQEYAKLDGEKRKFIKGQKYALLSHKENLQGSARKNLKILLAANKRLNTAYVLKESFGQLWDYNREAWARKFFENWRDQLKWQRLEALRELR